MKLDLGAGSVSPPGFTPLGRPHGSDIYPLSRFADKSADEISASHGLEHFPHREVLAVLREWVRVLKPGGLMKIAVPDFAKIAENYLKGVAQPTQSFVMGAQVDADDFHKALFDRERLTHVMITAGLVHIEPWRSELTDWAAAPISLNLCGRKPLRSELEVGSAARSAILLERAISLHQRGQLDAAASFYREILAHAPKNADALHLVGVLEAQRKSCLPAIEYMDRAIAIDPENVTFYFNRAEALRAMKRFDDALASYDLALAVEPQSVEALHKQGNTLQDLRRFDEAIISYDRALVIKPDHA